MTRGNIAKILAAFSAPLVLSGLLQQLYNWADALIVGNFVGEAQLSAIGASSAVSTFFVAILSGFSTGVSILVSTAYGQQDHRAIKRSTSVFFAVSAVSSVLLASLGIAFISPLLRLLNTPEDIFSHSRTYLSVIMLGVPFLAVYNHYSAVLRGIGDSRTPLMAILISSLLNVGLDLLLVAGWGMGVYGAAVATTISQAALAVFVFLFASVKYPMLRLERFPMKSDGVLASGLRLSIPTATQSAIRSVGGMMLQNIMNGFGSQVVAGVSSAYRVDSIALLPLVNLSAGISTFTAQNIGAENPERARKGLRVGCRISVLVSLAIIAIIVPLGGRLIGLFGVSEGAIEIGRGLILTLAAAYPVFAIQNAMIGYLQGIGDVVFTSAAGIASLALRIVLSYVLRPMLGQRVIAVAELIAWVALALVCGVRVYQKRGKTERTEEIYER